MREQLVSVAFVLLSGCGSIPAKQDLTETPDTVARPGLERSQWARDFTDRSPPTEACLGGTISALRSRMAVNEPFGKEALREHLPELAPQHVSPHDEIYSFQYTSSPDSAAGYWGFDGALIARHDCIIYVGRLGYDN